MEESKVNALVLAPCDLLRSLGSPVCMSCTRARSMVAAMALWSSRVDVERSMLLHVCASEMHVCKRSEVTT